jgi:beta-glucuronidase
VITYATESENADVLDTRVILRDADGNQVGAGTSGTLDVPNVHQWAPGDGYLYDLELQLLDGDTVVDSYHQSVRVRTIKIDGIRFLINGEPFYLTGFGKHEDLPMIGKGHNDAYLLHDFELLKWIGANSFRTSHYPYAEDVIDYADRQGIVVIDETAAVGLDMGPGGGIFGSQGYQTFSPKYRQRRHPRGACSSHSRADRPRQEPSERCVAEYRERARV